MLKSDNDIVIKLRLSLTVNKNFSVTLCIKHGTLYTKHDTLYIKHGTLYTKHCTLYTKHGTLYTEHFCEKTIKTYKHVDKNVSIIYDFQFIKSLI